MKNLPASPFLEKLAEQAAQQAERKAEARRAFRKKVRESMLAALASMTNNGWVTVYTNQVPYELDVLRSNLYPKSDMGWFISTVLGTGLSNPLFAVGFPCAPISPPGMSVTVGPGVIYYFDVLLPVAYSVIPADLNPDHQIYKSFISFDTQTFATPAPSTPGDSIIYLIQVAHETQAVNVVSRPYFNDADPSSPIFESQSDTMQDFAHLAVKAGVAAPSPTPPTPDPGYTALYHVTVAYGQTSIVTGNITAVSGAPFITESLTQKISYGQIQNSLPIYSADTGTTNAIVANVTPPYTAYQAGTQIYVKVANSNTGAATLNVNSLGAVDIKVMTNMGLWDLAGGEMQTGAIYQFMYNGTHFQLMNPAGASGSMIQVGLITAQSGTSPDPGNITLTSTAINRTTYARLFSYIGTTWGVGDGSTTFGITPPGYAFVGQGFGSALPGITDAVGQTGGEAQHTLSVGEIPAHAHTISPTNSVCAGSPGSLQVTTGGPSGFYTNVDLIIQDTGGGSSHNNIQPSAVVLYQIKY